MGYWQRARNFARQNAKMFTIWKAAPSVLGAGISILFHLQPMQQILTTAAVAVGCYALLYGVEFAWKLFVEAPAAIDKERDSDFDKLANRLREEVGQREANIVALNAQIQSLSKKPYEQAHENLTREKLSGLTESTREVLKYILHHPGVEERSIPVPDGAILARGCYNRGLLDRSEDRPGNGLVPMAAYFTVKENFRPVLEDIFYPKSS